MLAYARNQKFNEMVRDIFDRMGKGCPSLSFYARRKLHFLGPHDEKEWETHLAFSGKKIFIPQTPLRRDIPEAVSDWTVILEHSGFSLISSEPLL